MVRDALMDAFKGNCELDYTEREQDPDGTYAIDALVRGRVSLAIAVVPNQIDAERAVGNKIFLDPIIKVPHHWVAIPRDIDSLPPKSRRRLMKNFLAPIPNFADERDQLQPKLLKLAS